MTRPLIQVRDLAVDFCSSAGWLPWKSATAQRALHQVSFHVDAGTTLGIVGESGSGKTTLARTLMGLIAPQEGTVWIDSQQATAEDVQFVFQDPLAALNPRMTVEQLILEPLEYRANRLDKTECEQRFVQVLQQVGLDSQHRHRYAHEFSGGQCQRIGIARAIITRPRVLICDEPVSALDVSIRAQIIKLLQTLKQELSLTLIFIAHDLGLVRYISDRVLVMYRGQVLEQGPANEVFSRPQHPYTRNLLQAEPKPDPQLERQRRQEYVTLREQGTSATVSRSAGDTGCVYASRCPYCQPRCRTERPVVASDGREQKKVTCFYPLDTL